MGRDGTLPRSVFQLLLYPVVDLAMTGDSYARVTDGVPITAATMRWFVDHYAPDPETRDHWHAAPLRAGASRGAPPPSSSPAPTTRSATRAAPTRRASNARACR